MKIDHMRDELAERAMGLVYQEPCRKWPTEAPIYLGRDGKWGPHSMFVADWKPDENPVHLMWLIEMMLAQKWNIQIRQEEGERAWVVFWSDEKGDGHGHADTIQVAVCEAAVRALRGQREDEPMRSRWIDTYPKTMLLSRRTMEIPERIYLQIESGDYFEGKCPPVEDIHDATWCIMKVHDSDVEYVRRDIAAKLWAALDQELAYPFGARVLTGGYKLLGKTVWLRET